MESLRHRRHAGGRRPSCSPSGRPSARTAASPRLCVCSRLHRTEAGRGGPYPHDRLAGPQSSVARQFRQQRERGLSRGIAPGGQGHRGLPEGPSVPLAVCPVASRWSLWHGSGPLGSGGLRECSAGQGLHCAGSAPHPGSAAPARLSDSNGAKTSQITRSLYDCPNVPVGPDGVPCRVVVATHPAGKTKSRVGLTREAHGLRTLLYQLASAEFHGLRCGGAVFASRGLRADSLRRRQ
jgi:hypothetical protein